MSTTVPILENDWHLLLLFAKLRLDHREDDGKSIRRVAQGFSMPKLATMVQWKS